MIFIQKTKNSRMKKQLLLLFYGISLVTACLITNCPRGGKRGLISYLGKLGENQHNAKELPAQCTKCGPGGDGRCVGPELCCGPRIGCLIASPGIKSQCTGIRLNPSFLTSTCLISSGLGVCTVDGICCNSESCRIESTCEADPYLSICPNDTSENVNGHLN